MSRGSRGPERIRELAGVKDSLEIAYIFTLMPSQLPSPISFDDFLKVELRIGRIVEARIFPEARKPAYVLSVDFGAEIGIKKSSAQITDLYEPSDILGKLVVAVVNFPPKQVGPLMSECLVTGFHTQGSKVVLCVPDGDVPLGTRLL